MSRSFRKSSKKLESQLMNRESEVIKIMKDALEKNKSEIDAALIKPLSDDYPFSTNGLYIFLGKMGSGKTFKIWKHILMTERLDKKPYYNDIIFCSTSGELDKTAETFQKLVKVKITYLSEDDLMPYLERYLRRKMKYYAIVRHVLSHFKETSEEMQRIIDKHELHEIEDRISYICTKLKKYNITDYPINTLLILDDFAGSPLLKKMDSPLARILTKTRHYNLTAIIVAQTIRFLPLNLKRMATDMIIYNRYSDEDFLSFLEQTSNDLDKKEALKEYRKLTGPHDCLILNIVANKHEFVREK